MKIRITVLLLLGAVDLTVESEIRELANLHLDFQLDPSSYISIRIGFKVNKERSFSYRRRRGRRKLRKVACGLEFAFHHPA